MSLTTHDANQAYPDAKSFGVDGAVQNDTMQNDMMLSDAVVNSAALDGAVRNEAVQKGEVDANSSRQAQVKRRGNASRSVRRGWLSTKATSYVGIDIGERFVRVATVRTGAAGNDGFSWIGQHEFEIPTVDPGKELTPGWLQSVLHTIPRRLPRCIDGETNVAAIALPIAWTHYQTVAGNEIPETLSRCTQMFAESVFQSPANLCHWPVVGAHHGRPGAEDQYVIAATAEQTACQIADHVSAVGYNVQSILPHGVVLAHAAEDLTGVDAQCVIWLSQGAALITIRHESGVGLSRTMPSVPRRILELDQPLDAHALRPYLTEVATEFRATARYASRADMSPLSEKPILLAGPLAQIPGVDEVLATLTKTPVAVWSFLGSRRPAVPSKLADCDPSYVRRLDSSYAGALSLAVAATRGSSRGYGQ